MQVADKALVFNMLNDAQLRGHIKSVDPDLVVPEIEAINTAVLLDMEADEAANRTIVPSARAVDLTMNRDRIRDPRPRLVCRPRNMIMPKILRKCWRFTRKWTARSSSNR